MVESTLVRIATSVHKPLKVLAARKGLSMQELLTKIITEYLAQEKKKH